jgi:hypothetical protein
MATMITTTTIKDSDDDNNSSSSSSKQAKQIIHLTIHVDVQNKTVRTLCGKYYSIRRFDSHMILLFRGIILSIHEICRLIANPNYDMCLPCADIFLDVAPHVLFEQQKQEQQQ